MLSTRSPNAYTPASRAVARSSKSKSLASLSPSAARRTYTTRGFVVAKRDAASNKRLINGSRQKSWWSRCHSRHGDSIIRQNRSSWHRPECKWATSHGDPLKTPGDKDCPGCQEEESLSLGLSEHERIWQRHFSEYKRAIDRDPFDALFGWSNRRINSLWARPLSMGWYSFMTREVNDWAAQRASGLTSEKSCGSKEEGSHTTSSAKPTISASITWNTSGTTFSGQRFSNLGELIYDPITMRMKPKTPQSKPPTPTQEARECLDPQQLRTPTAARANLGARRPHGDTAIVQAEATGTLPSSLPSLEKYSRQSVDPDQPSWKADPTSHETMTTVERIQAKEREVQEAKRSLDLLKAKKHMEQSWMKAQKPSTDSSQDSKPVNPTHTVKPPTTTMTATRTSIDAWSNFKKAQAMKTTGSGHPSRPARPTKEWQAVRPVGLKPTPGTLSIFEKNKPIRSMTVEEFNAHRKALLDRWGRKSLVKTPVAKVDLVLEKEIKAQKFAMASFENKWKIFNTGSSENAVNANATRTRDLVPGEGDMSPTVLQCVDSSKWYKNAAPHALASEEQRLRDHELVKSIRRVYESSYGTIEKDHRQGELLSSASQLKNAETSEMKQKSEGSQDQTNRNGLSRPATYRTYVCKPGGHTQGMTLQPTSSLVQDLANHPAVLPEDAHQRLNKELQRVVNEMKEVNTILRDKEEIVFANRDVLVTRKIGNAPLPEAELKALARDNESFLQESRSRLINPVDGTTSPNLTPQIGNFASPTGFVNDDIHSPEAASRTPPTQPSPPPVSSSSSSSKTSKNTRRVRKEEPVFSGQMPTQKFTIKEVVEILNNQGVGPTIGSRSSPSGSSSNNSNGSSNNGGASGMYRGSKQERHQRHKERRFFRTLRRGAFFATWTALCCYSTGVLIEYFRNGPHAPVVEDRQGHASWDDYNWRRRRQETPVKAVPVDVETVKPEVRERSRDASRSTRSFADMPLRGAEYPLLGMLGACIWWLVGSGGS